MNSPIIDVIALSERHRLQEKEAHESTKEALASALAEVERLKNELTETRIAFKVTATHMLRICSDEEICGKPHYHPLKVGREIAKNMLTSL